MASLIVRVDSLRTVGHAAITNSYTALGIPFAHPMRILRIINNTDGDILISFDTTHDNLFLPASTYVLYDEATNKDQNSQNFTFQIGTQLYIKYSTAPSKGDVWVECTYGQGE